MDKNNTYIFEGKTYNEAIENGLKELKLSKNQVEIKTLEQEDKRSFFSILAPRICKVEIKIKENVQEKQVEKEIKKVVKTENVSKEDIDNCINKLKVFLDEFISKLPSNKLTYNIEEKDRIILINVDGEDSGYLIGYRGECLNALQTIISNIAYNNSKSRVRVALNIGGYREKREKDLQILATKIAGSVIKTKKDITLEPMPAYERKIIHTKLQDNDKVKTYSKGEEPYRRVVVAYNK